MKEEINIELIEQAPFLAKLEKTAPKAPEGYFEDMQTSVRVQLNMSKAEHISFTAPESYFENMQHEVMAKVNQHRSRPITVWATYAIAAGLVLVVSCMFIFKQYIKPVEEQSVSQFVSNLSDEDVLQYLDDESLDANFEDMADDEAVNAIIQVDGLEDAMLEEIMESESDETIESLF